MQLYDRWESFIDACETARAAMPRNVGSTFHGVFGNHQRVYVFTPRQELGQQRRQEETYAAYNSLEDFNRWIKELPGDCVRQLIVYVVQTPHAGTAAQPRRRRPFD